MALNRQLKVILFTTKVGKLVFKPYGYNKALLPVILLLLKGSLSGLWLGLAAGCILDMQWIPSKKKSQKPDLRVYYLMLTAYVTQMSNLLNAISFNALKHRLYHFFQRDFLETRFTFFNELLKQRIQVDAICKQLLVHGTKEENHTFLRFLITYTESPAAGQNRKRAIYYVANKLEIEEKDFLQFFHASTQTSATNPNIQYFRTLQVDENVSYNDLRKAYYRLAKMYHPDMNNGSKQRQDNMQVKFRQVTEAYEKIKVLKGWR